MGNLFTRASPREEDPATIQNYISKLQDIQQDIGAGNLTILADSDTLTTLEKMYELIQHINDHEGAMTAKQFCDNETLLYNIMFEIKHLTEEQRDTIYGDGIDLGNWMELELWVNKHILKLGQYDSANKTFCGEQKFKF